MDRLLLSEDWARVFRSPYVEGKEQAVLNQLRHATDRQELGRLQGQLMMLDFLRDTLPKRVSRELQEAQTLRSETRSREEGLAAEPS